MKNDSIDLNNSETLNPTKDIENLKDTLNKTSVLNNTGSVKNQSQIIKIIKPKQIKKIIIYLNQKVQIPTVYSERVEYVKKIFSNEELDFIITYAPFNKTTTAKELGKYFKSKLKTIVEIANGILYYFYKSMFVSKKIFENNANLPKKTTSKNSPKMRTPDDILHSGEINNSEELMSLYKELCDFSGVRIELISGLIKKPKYKLGDSLVKHEWCILNCGIEKYYLIDVLLSIGEINEVGEFVKELKPFYFLTPPLFFLENHFPDDEKYQYIPRPIKVKEFTRRIQSFTENFYNGIFKYKVTLQTHTCPEFNCKDSEINIKFLLDNLELIVECFTGGKKIPDENAKITDNNLKGNYVVTLIFPGNGEYKVNIKGKKPGTNDPFTLIFSYTINVKITNVIKHEPKPRKKSPKKLAVPYIRSSTPEILRKKQTNKGEKKLNKCASDFGEKIKNKCYDNSNAHLFEPRCKILRIGQEAKFRLRVRNAKSVVVLDGRKWNFLHKKEDDIFEGIVPIQSENIVICAMRSNNIYTEVFEFLAIKR